MAMEVRDYCRNLDAELTGWKARLYDVVRQLDQRSTGDKEKVYTQINALHIVMTELEDRIDQLRVACPTEWSPQRKEIGEKIADLSCRYKEAQKVAFDYDFGG
ncbi:MAG: hypothetical protein AB1634_19200 [Thermodesulfobacteriota bacterium]